MARLTPSQSLAEDQIWSPTGFPEDDLTLFADGTRVVVRAKGTERAGVTFGRSVESKPYPFQAVRWDDGTEDHVAPHVLHKAV